LVPKVFFTILITKLLLSRQFEKSYRIKEGRLEYFRLIVDQLSGGVFQNLPSATIAAAKPQLWF